MMAHDGTLGARGQLGARLIRRSSPPWTYRLRNVTNIWRGRWRKQVADLFGIPTIYAELSAVLVHADGSSIHYGVVATRVITTEFCAHLVDALGGTTTRISDYDYHDAGTGTTAEAAGDTALVTPYGGARATGTASEPSSTQYRSVGTISFTSTLAITEHGLFSAASGTDELMDRSVFSAINVVSGDSIQFTYTVSFTAGG
jgi:hypothetical protein